MDRRQFGRGAVALVALGSVARALAGDDHAQKSWGQKWQAIEAQVGGRLGVAVLDTGTGELVGHRLDERFAMCSTFKALVAGLVLARVDAGQERLDRRVMVAPADVLEWAPVTRKHVGATMSLAELCDAAITQSDNTAANLLLANLGGPPAVTAFARKLGDAVTRLDRTEPAMNDVQGGDPRDTSTPRAMAATLRTLALGDALSAAGRAQLVAWMTANAVGAGRLRAGLPSDWRVADKTGTSNDLGIANDMGVLWPPHRAPLVVVSYLCECKAPADARDRALADVARVIAGAGWTPAS